MTALRIGIIGKTGQVAWALQRACDVHSFVAVSFGRDVLELNTDGETLMAALSTFNDKVDVIINAAAYTAVDKAEDDAAEAHQINAVAPGVIATYCANQNIPFIHISTDYVFNGDAERPYVETDEVQPLNVYGQSKLAGEKAVQTSGCVHAILRTSWVYDAQGRNFMTGMLNMAQHQADLRVVDDQFGRPTYAPHMAEACLRIARGLLSAPEKSQGIFHVTDTGPVISWHRFACAIFKSARASLPHEMNVSAIPSSKYPTRAERPRYSALDVSKFEQTFSYTLPHWQAGIEHAIQEWSQSGMNINGQS